MIAKILIVDDEEQLVELMKMKLEAGGYRVITAYDGSQGLHKARSAQPDLIILDVMLPRLDGYKVCRLLKFDQNYNEVPVVMLTARGQESDRRIGENVGADAYIVKPFDDTVLLETIRRLLKDRAHTAP